jgi:hypothetical protein
MELRAIDRLLAPAFAKGAAFCNLSGFIGDCGRAAEKEMKKLI